MAIREAMWWFKCLNMFKSSIFLQSVTAIQIYYDIWLYIDLTFYRPLGHVLRHGAAHLTASSCRVLVEIPSICPRRPIFPMKFSDFKDVLVTNQFTQKTRNTSNLWAFLSTDSGIFSHHFHIHMLIHTDNIRLPPASNDLAMDNHSSLSTILHNFAMCSNSICKLR